MHISHGNKKTLMKVIACMLFMAGLLLSGYARAETSVADLDSAYEYYKNVATVSGNATPTSTPTHTSHPPAENNINDVTGLGGIANNLMGPVEVVAGFLTGASIAAGLACLFGAFVRYMQYRTNPLAHPIGTVITMLILGLLLLLLPLIYKLTESGIPVSIG